MNFGNVFSYLVILILATLSAAPVHAQDAVVNVTATVETTPVPHSGDAADDSVVWVHPSDPTQSILIGTDKQGGLGLYDLSGAQRSFHSFGEINNIDIRYGFMLGGVSTPIIAASNRSNNSVVVYKIDPSTRAISSITARTLAAGIEVYGFCMYRNAQNGKTYAFVNAKSGAVRQFEFFESAGKVDMRLVRSFSVGSQVEGCVADDQLGHFYIGEETRGIWKYGAEPTAGSTRTQVDTVSGHIRADVEGLTMYYGANGTGYLIASSQGNNRYVIYERAGNNAFAGAFNIASGAIDGTSDTDGIKVMSFGLGSRFPEGVFIAQDGSNTGGNQNFKLVPWGSIARALNLRIDTSQDPRNVGGVVIPEEPEEPEAPLAPSNVVAQAVSSSRIDLQWQHNTDSATSISVERSTDNINFAQIISLDGGPAMYSNTGLTASTRYYYRLRAINAAGSSPYSAVANAVTQANVPDPEEPPPTSGTHTFNVVEDATVRSASANTNFGMEASLEADQSPLTQVLLKFQVSGIAGTVQSAKVRIYVSGASNNGPEIYKVANTWTETGVNFNNKPAVSGAMLSDKSKVAVGYQEYDVKPAITSNGTYSFAFISDSTDGLDVDSKQSSRPAQLIIVSASSTSTPAPSQPQQPQQPNNPAPQNPAPSAGINPWIANAFASAPVMTGNFTSRQSVESPAIVKNATASNGKYAFAPREESGADDRRVAFVNVNIKDLKSTDTYGGGIGTSRSHENMNLFLSNVYVEPNWPTWKNYDSTNYDGLVLDGSAAIYAEDLTIKNWNADSAIDIKSNTAQFVRLITEGKGNRTLRFWRVGPHHIVDSNINNTGAVGKGSLIWISDCANTTIKVYNSRFNGSNTIPANKIECESGSNPKIIYLTVDPKTTGEMHPMFTGR